MIDALSDKEEGSEPDQIVEFDTDAFYVLLDTLVKQHRQAVLAMGGDVYLWLDGKNILVRLPSVGGDGN